MPNTGTKSAPPTDEPTNTEDKVRHQSSSLVAERGDTTGHESNHHNDNENLSLNAHLGVSLSMCESIEVMLFFAHRAVDHDSQAEANAK
jgi:hypothetical protein